MVKTTKKAKLGTGEKLVWIFLILLVVASPVMIVFSQATLSKSNIELSNIKNKINDQSSLNESLTMKINELASLDKIQEVAKNLGLSYNNDNIKVISEE